MSTTSHLADGTSELYDLGDKIAEELSGFLGKVVRLGQRTEEYTNASYEIASKWPEYPLWVATLGSLASMAAHMYDLDRGLDVSSATVQAVLSRTAVNIVLQQDVLPRDSFYQHPESEWPEGSYLDIENFGARVVFLGPKLVDEALINLDEMGNSARQMPLQHLASTYVRYSDGSSMHGKQLGIGAAYMPPFPWLPRLEIGVGDTIYYNYTKRAD
jgi:hypothetical protein